MSDDVTVTLPNVRLAPDGNVKYTLTYSHREFLKFIGKSGGEVTMNWDSVSNPKAREHMQKLVTMGLVKELALVGTENRYLLRLTDIGKNILAMIEEREMKQC